MPVMIRDTKKATLNFEAGGTVTTDYIRVEQKREMATFLAHIPASFNGVLFPVVSDSVDGPYEVAYNSLGTLVYADPSSKILPAWYAMDAEVLFPAHYIKFFSATSTAGTAGTAQASARVIRVMGLS